MLGFTVFDLPFLAREHPTIPIPPAPASVCIGPPFEPVLDEYYINTDQLISPALATDQGFSGTEYAVTIPFANVSQVTASFWARGRENSGFDLVMGLFDPSNALVASNDDGGWRPTGDGANSYFKYVLNQIGTYTVEISAWSGDTGRYALYISPSNEAVATTTIAGGLNSEKVLYSQTGKKVFVISTPASESKADVLDPISNVVEYSYPFEALYDAVYNSVNDRIYLWTSSSLGNGMVEISGSGTGIVATTTFAASPVTASGGLGWMACNDDNNQILMVSETSGIYYIFDCATRTIVKNGTMTNGTYPAYCNTQNAYYINHAPFDFISKLDAVSFVETPLAQSASGKISYLSDIDRLVITNIGTNAFMILNPSTDTVEYTTYYSAAFNGAVFDPCTNAIVTIADGNYRIFTTGSYQPGNYISSGEVGFRSAVFVNTSSRVYACGTVDSGIVKIYSTATTAMSASVLSPTIPSPRCMQLIGQVITPS
jgi:hypothetical protein